MTDEQIAGYVVDVPDFPEPGVTFKDLTPLMRAPAAFRTVVDRFVGQVGHGEVDVVVGIEARGFILAPTVAYRLAAGFVPARKQGKLPRVAHTVGYDLEYASATLQLPTEAIHDGDRVLVVDDVLATGGTAAATVELVESAGGRVVGCHFLLELGFLDGRTRLDGVECWSLLTG